MRLKWRISLVIAMAVLTALVSGCGLRKVKDINVVSCGAKYVVPTSSRSVEAILLLELDNPAMAFTVSDVDGLVYYKGRELGTFTAGELPVQARSVQVYELPCTAKLSDGVSLLDLLVIGAKGSLDGITVDVNLDVKLKKINKRLSFKDIDISQFSMK